jgi:hypothetical protein
MYFSKQLAFEKGKYDKLERKNEKKWNAIQSKLVENSYFSLENNDNAQNYFNPDNATKTIQIDKLISVVTESLLDLNSNPKGNPFTGQDQLGANKFIINKVKIINHRWIIADYSDGEFWGEVVLKYFINEDETVSFEVIQSLLYQK